MRNRIIVGVILVALVAVTLVLGGYVLMALGMLCMIGTLYEMYRAVRHKAPTVQLWPMVLYVVLVGIGAKFWGILGMVAAFVAAVVVVFSYKILCGELDFEGILYSVFILVYPGLFSSMLYTLTLLPDPINRMGVLMAIFMASMPDMFAYFVGMAVGKHKMAPIISPKKSWEGFGGSLLGGLVTGVAVYLIQGIFGLTTPIYHYLILGVICSVAGVAGDLSASLVKRAVGIKDYSHLFLEHGGLMDRLDSVMFVAPVICLYYLFLV